VQSVTTSAKQRAVGGTRRRAPVEWSERDGRLLRIVGEQYAITVQQLAGLLGRTHRNGRWLRDRWLRAGWIESHPFGWHGPSFLWLTGKGIRVCDSPYRRWRPNTAMPAHIEAVTDVRLLLAHELRLGRWTCERALAQASPSRSVQRPHLPDGLLDLPDGPVAVEVELTSKSRARSSAIVEELAASYARVWYFAAPSLLPAVRALAVEVPWGNVDVFPYPPRADLFPQ
jgi:hypothetical protein